MNEVGLYSIKEISNELNVDWQTLLRWKYQFDFYIPTYRQENQLKYTTQAAKIFAVIHLAKQLQLKDEVINIILDKHFYSDTTIMESLQLTIQELTEEMQELRKQLEEKQRNHRQEIIRSFQGLTWKELCELKRKCPEDLLLEDVHGSNINREISPVKNWFQLCIKSPRILNK
ncbi:hypothetical protein [Ammoniphilus resinae]|uniref:DNA-binding transcriptional MerR regulator n=1 Tax=Ammoniphilus resinae TaxID=861532 RepID=A0ABS4GR49_9BACL|nr:hypothetical protein [Ammoniphilus resinae]MBP1932709.1 DNA-binding transcriptional MerR regulator [Ammoniphilus resinae]